MKERERREFAEKHPLPTTAVESLAHVLEMFAELPDDQLMIQATSGVYGPGVRTGLTLGNLRELAGMERGECTVQWHAHPDKVYGPTCKFEGGSDGDS